MRELKNVSVLRTAAATGATEYARGLLARCEAGEVVAVTAIEEHPGGTYELGGTVTPSRFQTAGMMLEAAVTRLSK